MSRRRPTKAERDRVIAVDLLANWASYATPLPMPCSEYDWRYYGTITLDGKTGALAWRAGGFAKGNGSRLSELSPWDRIKVQRILIRKPPGHAGAPSFTPAQAFNMAAMLPPLQH